MKEEKLLKDELRDIDKKDTQAGLFIFALLLSAVCSTGCTAIATAVMSVFARENGIAMDVQVEFAERVMQILWFMYFFVWLLVLIIFGNFMASQAIRLRESYIVD